MLNMNMNVLKLFPIAVCQEKALLLYCHIKDRSFLCPRSGLKTKLKYRNYFVTQHFLHYKNNSYPNNIELLKMLSFEREKLAYPTFRLPKKSFTQPSAPI